MLPEAASTEFFPGYVIRTFRGDKVCTECCDTLQSTQIVSQLLISAQGILYVIFEMV